MPLTLNANDAKRADNVSSVIRDSGKYIGTITRAEKLISRNNVEGLGLSFKTDDGASANYLDIYTVKPDGERLRGYNIVQAILCCLRLRTINEGEITFQRWDSEQRALVEAEAEGYPDLMGKRIGLLLQKELQTHSVTGQDVERMSILGVFEPSTGLMATEILDGKTKPERIDAFLKLLARTPVRDTRKGFTPAPERTATPAAAAQDFDDDIPF